jgi:hypothetical protein
VLTSWKTGSAAEDFLVYLDRAPLVTRVGGRTYGSTRARRAPRGDAPLRRRTPHFGSIDAQPAAEVAIHEPVTGRRG